MLYCCAWTSHCRGAQGSVQGQKNIAQGSLMCSPATALWHVGSSDWGCVKLHWQGGFLNTGPLQESHSLIFFSFSLSLFFNLKWLKELELLYVLRVLWTARTQQFYLKEVN